MTLSKEFDVIVIGAGPGGYATAIRAAQLGLSVACVDKNKRLGGTCLRIGCIPSKALLDSTHLLAMAQSEMKQHGINVGNVDVDLKQMMERKEKIVQTLANGVSHLLKNNDVTFFEGSAQLSGSGKVTVGERNTKETLQAKSIILATGSMPQELPDVPFDGDVVVSSTEALNFDKVPEHLLVVGGGYIGLELGSVWARLGSKVTVLEFLPHILGPSDREVADVVHRRLKKQGIEFHLQAKVTGVDKKKGKTILYAEHEGEEKTFAGDKVLVAIGRRPAIDGLGLEDAGVSTDEDSGRISVNDQWQTSVKNVYAIGDLIAGPMLAHKATVEGIAVAERLAGQPGIVNYDAIPSVVYTSPELAAIGLTEQQLKEQDREYHVGKHRFSGNGRAHCLGETDGLVKVLADARTDQLLGVHMAGPSVSELLPELVLAFEYSGTAEDIARTCHAHPTLAEAVHEASHAAWAPNAR